MPASRTRTRPYSIGGESNYRVTTVSGVTNETFVPKKNLYDVCTDQVHPGPPYKSGGPLSIQHLHMEMFKSSPHMYRRNYVVSGNKNFEGQFYASQNFVAPTPGFSSLSGWGARGWNRALPVKPVLNIGQFLIELKDAPQMAKTTYEWFSQFKGSKWSGRSAAFWGDQILNYGFGWKPFINDLWNMVNVAKTLDDKRNFILRNNHKRLHRKIQLYTFHDFKLESSTTGNGLIGPGDTTGLTILGGGQDVTLETDDNIWFEGKFSFNIPERFLYGPASPVLDLGLLGLYPDLNLIWKVTPWTWLLDWFSSVGDILGNVSQMWEYGQVADYAYVMRHQKYVRSVYATSRISSGSYNSSSTPVTLLPFSAQTISTSEYLQRSVASPYGFGLTWAGFNPFQLSILAALGLSRSKFE